MSTLPIAPFSNANYTNLNRLLENYFNCAFAYCEIVEFVKVYHSKNISLPTVKRKFEKMGLSRSSIVTQKSPDVEVEAAVQDEITGSGSNVGYRRVWALLQRKCVIARREDERQLLLRLDPEAVERRKS